MTFTLRHKTDAILQATGWKLPRIPVVWSSRMTRCAGLFVIEKDNRDLWHPEIRLSIPLLRRRDWPWPQQVCGVHCHDPESIVRRILEHELIHYKLWFDHEKDWGHSERFKELALRHFDHQSVTHGIGDGQDS
jgi:SprT-like family